MLAGASSMSVIARRAPLATRGAHLAPGSAGVGVRDIGVHCPAVSCPQLDELLEPETRGKAASTFPNPPWRSPCREAMRPRHRSSPPTDTGTPRSGSRRTFHPAKDAARACRLRVL